MRVNIKWFRLVQRYFVNDAPIWMMKMQMFCKWSLKLFLRAVVSSRPTFAWSRVGDILLFIRGLSPRCYIDHHYFYCLSPTTESPSIKEVNLLSAALNYDAVFWSNLKIGTKRLFLASSNELDISKTAATAPLTWTKRVMWHSSWRLADGHYICPWVICIFPDSGFRCFWGLGKPSVNHVVLVSSQELPYAIYYRLVRELIFKLQ